MTTPAVQFDYDSWIARYPEFSAVAQPTAQAYFDEANSYCANDTLNPAFGISVPSGTTTISLLLRLLNMVTAHIAFLNAPRDGNGNAATDGGQQASPIVGRIASASEGSVSVSSDFKGDGSPSQDFFAQSKYGLAYWQATSQFRTFQYAARPTVVVGSIFPYRGRR